MNPIFLYIPNLIGYARIVLGFLSLPLMNHYPKSAMLLYSFSCVLDALDGFAARYYNQSSLFGACLDMVTDRCITACLMIQLALLYPSFTIIFQFLIALDFTSHYILMFATSKSGLQSHKTTNKNTNWLLNMYYTSRTMLFLVCAGNELFYISLYLYYHYSHVVLIYISLPIFLFKQVMNVIQLMEASMMLVELDLKRE